MTGAWRALALAAALTVTLTGGAGAQMTNFAKGHDSSQPIEITSDTLEVKQDENTAIFRGRVDAVQGDMNQRADELVVHYTTDDAGNNTISVIEATGNVFIASPDSLAQGDHGVYDVTAETIDLDGSVVLTRDDNVIRGDRLRLNLATGKSKMQSNVAKKGGNGRVKALFVPKPKDQ